MALYATPDDVCNGVISELGFERRIAELGEGSPAAKAFLDLYGQTRDEQLVAGMGAYGAAQFQPWPFSVARVGLAAPIKSQTTEYPGAWNSATMPPPPWLYEWSLPTDFLRELGVMLLPVGPGIDYDPKPHRWKIVDDNQISANGSKALVTMDAGPTLIYVAQMLDPTTWDPGYTANVIASLKRKAVLALKKDPQLLGILTQTETGTEARSGAAQA